MTAEMGRPKTAWLDLPPRMTARKLASGKCLYYYQARGKKVPLGANLLAAKQEWVRLESGAINNAFPAIAKQYRLAILPTLATGSQKRYGMALDRLETAFGAFSIEQIEPHDVKDYMGKRSRKTAAVFEKRILSTMFNWARGQGITSAPNPCAGMSFTKAEKKTFDTKEPRPYVSDDEFAAVRARARARGDDVVEDAMDLALVTGQRPGDILKAKRQDIKDGVLWVVQEKTGATVGIKVEDALQRVIDRILARKRPSMYLISNRHGQKIPYNTLNKRFVKARGDAKWQFRDIRGKAGTDSATLQDAQHLLGHTNELTTAKRYRHGKGAVSPLKRKV